MTEEDRKFLEELLRQKLIHSPCLELGTGLEWSATREQLSKHDIQSLGTDMFEGPAVDYVIDFERPFEEIQPIVADRGQFGTVLIFNILEHTFDPLRVLDNAIELVKPGGTCAVLTPSIWPIHGFPIDCWRILPDFYIEYAKRREVSIVENTLQFLSSAKGSEKLNPNPEKGGSHSYPLPGSSKNHYWYSKMVHKLFNTFGRRALYPPHVAAGVVFQKGL